MEETNQKDKISEDSQSLSGTMRADDKEQTKISNLSINANKAGAIYTAYDSLDCKYQAMKAGYFLDDFDHTLERVHDYLVIHQGLRSIKRPPLINKGYSLRIHAFQKFLNSFLKTVSSPDSSAHLNKTQTKQLIFLGCGYDCTAYQLLHSRRRSQHESTDANEVKIWEVDFDEVIQRKTEMLNYLNQTAEITEPKLGPQVSKYTEVNSLLSCSQYSSDQTHDMHFLLKHDLNMSVELINTLINNGFDPCLPTAIVTECVFVYMDQDSIRDLVSSFHNLLSSNNLCNAWFSYDMLHLQDSFGQMMIKNLQRAAIQVPGISLFPSLMKQEDLFSILGWEKVSCMSMLDYYNRLTLEEKDSMNKIERFDEMEEWNLVLSHYSFSLLSTDINFSIE